MKLRNEDLKNMVDEGILKVHHIAGTVNPSDGFSKILGGDAWKRFTALLVGDLNSNQASGG